MRTRLLTLLAVGLAATPGRGDEPGWQPATPAEPPRALPQPAAPGQPVWVRTTTAPAWQPAAPIPVPPQDPPPKPPTKQLPPPKKLPPEEAPPPQPAPTPKTTPEPPKPLPQPRPVEPPAPKTAPKPTEPPPAPIPNDPRSAIRDPRSEFVLEPPPGGVVPAGVGLPVRRGVIGSPPVTISRDGSLLDIWGAGLFADETETAAVGAAAVLDRSFVSLEYLLWWVRAAEVPVLASTASNRAFANLGDPGTQPLLGPGGFGTTARSGFRVRAGTWFDNAPVGGLDGGFFFLGRQSTTFDINSDQYPTIARPVFAPNLNREFGELVAFPGLSTGRLLVENTSRLWGADVNARHCLSKECDGRAELFAGYRHLNLREELSVTEFITAGGPLSPDPAGTSVVVNDTFRTRNRFHGGQVGWAGSRRAGRLEVSARASVALGVTQQEVEISGTQARTRPGEGTERFTGGLLAAGPNLGTFSRSRFSAAPEATLNLGVWATPGVKAFVGYNFILWTNTLRPGDQIDRTVDLSFVPNAPPVGQVANRPLPTFRQADFWAQGVQFGVEARW